MSFGWVGAVTRRDPREREFMIFRLLLAIALAAAILVPTLAHAHDNYFLPGDSYFSFYVEEGQSVEKWEFIEYVRTTEKFGFGGTFGYWRGRLHHVSSFKREMLIEAIAAGKRRGSKPAREWTDADGKVHREWLVLLCNRDFDERTFAPGLRYNEHDEILQAAYGLEAEYDEAGSKKVGDETRERNRRQAKSVPALRFQILPVDSGDEEKWRNQDDEDGSIVDLDDLDDEGDSRKKADVVEVRAPITEERNDWVRERGLDWITRGLEAAADRRADDRVSLTGGFTPRCLPGVVTLDMRRMKFVLPETEINKLADLKKGARFSVIGARIDTYVRGDKGWELFRD